MRKIDLTGQTFGELIVLREDGRSKHGQVMWLCQCSCGEQTRAFSANLRKKQRSCGCLVRTRGGLTGTPEFRAWRNMIARCCNPTDVSFGNYGGRGIIVCERWRRSFDDFLADVGKRPVVKGRNGHPEFTLDRIDNNRGYEPGNVRWATWQDQQNNRRSNTLITHCGKTQTLAAWAEETGIGRATISYRLKRGWTTEEALSRAPRCGKPPRKRVVN